MYTNTVLLYELEYCQLSNTDLQSLDFTFNRLFMKLFRTNSIDVVSITSVAKCLVV